MKSRLRANCPFLCHHYLHHILQLSSPAWKSIITVSLTRSPWNAVIYTPNRNLACFSSFSFIRVVSPCFNHLHQIISAPSLVSVFALLSSKIDNFTWLSRADCMLTPTAQARLPALVFALLIAFSTIRGAPTSATDQDLISFWQALQYPDGTSSAEIGTIVVRQNTENSLEFP